MVEIIQPVDPVQKAIAYLTPFFPDVVFGLGVPSDWTWGPLLIVVSDAGGAGTHDYILDNAYLRVEISCQDVELCSETARKIHGLLAAWQFEDRAVYWDRTLQRPTYALDEETEVPSYSLTVSMNFRMTREQVTAP